MTATKPAPSDFRAARGLVLLAGAAGAADVHAAGAESVVPLLVTFYLVIAVLAIYMVRHTLFTMNRLFGKQRHPYIDVDTADWPTVTVLVPAHNEELVIGNCLDALLDVDYPPERITVVPIDDRSTDTTLDIIHHFQSRAPERIKPLVRRSGPAGKAAAIQAASKELTSEIVLVFDADYVPGRGLIKQLVAPFFDPEVGAVMGRVVPYNTGANLLTRLLDLERAGGYQVDQQARMNLGLLPQYGGSVGGARVEALRLLGGWREDALAEDTDFTYRLLLAGFKVAYENRCECYEEVPEVWQERNRQIMRWTKGHNQTAARYFWRVVRSPLARFAERLDALLLLGVYAVAPLLLVGWACALTLYFLGVHAAFPVTLILLCLVGFSSFGNFAAFFEIAAATHLDGTDRRVRLLPLNFASFLVSFVNIVRATIGWIVGDLLLGRELHWAKTARYGNGNAGAPMTDENRRNVAASSKRSA